MQKISAVIITFNEERNIARCLDSLVGIADDVVVVDSYSTDQTQAICLQKGARFVQHPFEGHIEQKNYALSQALYPCVLSLDADEALSEPLQAAILEAKTHWPCDAYTMNRLSNFCGQWIHYSGWYPDRKLRLFDTRKGRWGGINPHDRVEMEKGASTQWLKGDLYHFSYYTHQEHWERSKKYGQIGAKALFLSGKKTNLAQIVIAPVFKFIRNYILKMGILDGKAGLRICLVAAMETYWKYSLLYKMKA